MAFIVPVAVSVALSVGSQLLMGLFANKGKKEQDPLVNVPKSDYGAFIPKIYGKVRLEGNKFFPKNREQMYKFEEGSSGGGGKGGGGSKSKQKKVYGTIAVMFCEGPVELNKLIIQGEIMNPNDEFFNSYCTWFDGTQTEPWSVVQSKGENLNNQVSYEGLAYVGINECPLDRYGNQMFSQVSAILTDKVFGDEPSLDLVVGDILTRAGIPSNRWDVSDLSDITLYYGIVDKQTNESKRQLIESLMEIYLFAPYEKDGVIYFKKINQGSGALPSLNGKHFIPNESGVSYSFKMRTDYELPSKLSVQYYNENKFYNQDEVSVYLGEREDTEQNTKTLDRFLYCVPYNAEKIANNVIAYLYTQGLGSYKFSFPLYYYNQIDLLDAYLLPNGQAIQIVKKSKGANGIIEFEANVYDSTESDYTTNPTTGDSLPALTTPVIPDIYIIDCPVLPNDLPASLYCFATEYATIQYSDNGQNSWDTATIHYYPSIIGTCDTIFSNGASSLTVTLISGSGLESITDDEFAVDLGQNLAFVGRQVNGSQLYEGEFFQFRDAVITGTNTYQLSNFKRNQNGTSDFTHTLGELFFLFQGVGSYYSIIKGNASQIGQSIAFRPVAYDYQNLATTTITGIVPSGNSYKPPAVFNLQAQEDGEGNIRLTWEYNPNISAYANQTSADDIAYDVVIGNNIRTLTTNKTQVIYLISDRTDDSVTKPFTATVYAVNNVFGRGLPTSITVNTTPINGTVFGTGEDGFKGIKTITNDAIAPTQFSYTVTEEDNNWILLIINPNVTYSDLIFPNTLSNGFTCQVVADGTTSNINSRVRFIVSDLLQPDDNLDILAGSTITVTHAGSGKYSILGNNRKYLQVNSDNSIAVRKTWNFLAKNLGTANQSINIEYLEDFGDRSNIIFSIVDAYIETLISNSATVGDLQTLIENLELLIQDIEDDITAINTAISGLLSTEQIQDMLSSFLVAGSNIELLYNDTANTLTINSTATGGGGGGTAIAKYYIQGNISNTTRITPVLNKSIHSIKLFNNAGTSQDIRVACKVGANTLTQDAYLLPSQQTISFNYQYPINFVSANDGIALECSSGNVNYFIEYSDANTDSFVQTSVAGNTLTTVYTATGNIAIPFIKLLNANTTVASQSVSLYVQGILRETVTLLQGQSIDLSPDTSINLSSGQTVAVQCTVGIVNCFIQTTNV